MKEQFLDGKMTYLWADEDFSIGSVLWEKGKVWSCSEYNVEFLLVYTQPGFPEFGSCSPCSGA